MSDNRRRYFTIKQALKELYPEEPQGNQARHLETLAALISGIVGSHSSQLPNIASRVPDGTKKESRVKKYHRWIKNERIALDSYFLPYATALLQQLAERGPLVLAIDGSDIGRGCATLLISVIYEHRALPLLWLVREGNQGHFDEVLHIELVRRLQPHIPEGAEVIFLGDGEFDGVELQATLAAYDWWYVCRTAQNTQLGAEGEHFAFTEVALQPGEQWALPEMTFTLQDYGPILAIGWWEQGYQEPLYLVTNMDLAAEACYWYRRRFRIETFFSDQKSRGFNLDLSHISSPQRLARLMIAACLAYIWIVYLGVVSKRDAWVSIIHRTDRCDWSLFRLGLELLEHFLNEDLPIPVNFVVPRLAESVR